MPTSVRLAQDEFRGDRWGARRDEFTDPIQTRGSRRADQCF